MVAIPTGAIREIVLPAVAFPSEFAPVATVTLSVAPPTPANPTGARHWETYAIPLTVIRAKIRSLVTTTPRIVTMHNP